MVVSETAYCKYEHNLELYIKKAHDATAIMNSYANKKVKSIKVKNPCKICTEAVNNRTGLQCKGACRKWAHFECLNFATQQIEDVRCGYLKINCPCPDCENENKVYQYVQSSAERDESKEYNRYQSQMYGENKEYNSKQYKCSKTSCPGIPEQTIPKGCDDLDLLEQTLKPLPYGVSQGTSYECIVETRMNKNVDEQMEDDDENMELEEEEDEEISDAVDTERNYQTVLLVKSSSQITAAPCCDATRMSPVNTKNVQTKNSNECCVTGPCSSSSSSSGKKKGKKKGGKKEKKERKKKKEHHKNRKKIKKEGKKQKREEKKQRKEEKKGKKGERKKDRKKKKVHSKKGESPPCCHRLTPCCNSDVISKTSKRSNESDESYESSSSTSAKSANSAKSTRSTQAPCGKVEQICPRKGASSPIKLMKSEGCSVNVDVERRQNATQSNPMNRPVSGQGPHYNPTRYGRPMPPMRQPQSQPYYQSNPNCPPDPRNTLQRQQNIPPSYGPGMQPISKCPPNCPGPGGGRPAAVPKSLGKCGACLPGCCDANRARTVVPIASSTNLLCLSSLNKSRSYCTLDRMNRKVGKSLENLLFVPTYNKELDILKIIYDSKKVELGG